VIISIEKHHGGHCSESHTSTDSDGKSYSSQEAQIQPQYKTLG